LPIGEFALVLTPGAEIHAVAVEVSPAPLLAALNLAGRREALWAVTHCAAGAVSVEAVREALGNAMSPHLYPVHVHHALPRDVSLEGRTIGQLRSAPVASSIVACAWSALCALGSVGTTASRSAIGQRIGAGLWSGAFDISGSAGLAAAGCRVLSETVRRPARRDLICPGARLRFRRRQRNRPDGRTNN
jgi:hypothetical protein